MINLLENNPISKINPRTATTFSTPRTAKRCHLTPAYISMSKTYDIGYYSFLFSVLAITSGIYDVHNTLGDTQTLLLTIRN